MHEDLYTDVTARIIAALEQGVAPWVRPWSTGIDTLPMNASTKRAYRGINVMLLALEAQTAGYPLQSLAHLPPDRWNSADKSAAASAAQPSSSGRCARSMPLPMRTPTRASLSSMSELSRCYGPSPCST